MACLGHDDPPIFALLGRFWHVGRRHLGSRNRNGPGRTSGGRIRVAGQGLAGVAPPGGEGIGQHVGIPARRDEARLVADVGREQLLDLVLVHEVAVAVHRHRLAVLERHQVALFVVGDAVVGQVVALDDRLHLAPELADRKSVV